MLIALRTLLVLIFVANVAGLVQLLLAHEQLLERFPRLCMIQISLLAVFGLLSLVSVGLIWSWRRWGVYLLTCAYAGMLIINLYYHAPPAHTWLGPLGLLALFSLLWPQRHLLR